MARLLSPRESSREPRRTGSTSAGGELPASLLDTVAARCATLFVNFMPYANPYAMRSAAPADVGLQAILDHLGAKVEAARKPEPLARIMMASAVLHAGADYVRTHSPEMIRRLTSIARTSIR